MGMPEESPPVNGNAALNGNAARGTDMDAAAADLDAGVPLRIPKLRRIGGISENCGGLAAKPHEGESVG